MEKYVLDGEEYIYNNGKWLNSRYLGVPLSIADKLNKMLASKDDLEIKEVSELIEIVDGAKRSGNTSLAFKAMNIAMKNGNFLQIKSLLPRLTSLYRMCGLPQKAIDTTKEHTDKYGSKIGSPALYTSLAAAYCDIGEYKTAKYYADKAFAMQGGNISGELSGVYGRLKKENGDLS